MKPGKYIAQRDIKYDKHTNRIKIFDEVRIVEVKPNGRNLDLKIKKGGDTLSITVNKDAVDSFFEKK